MSITSDGFKSNNFVYYNCKNITEAKIFIQNENINLKRVFQEQLFDKPKRKIIL